MCSFDDDLLPENTSPEKLINYVDISNVENGRVQVPNESFAFGDSPSRARRLVRPGDVVISTVRTYLRAVAAVPNETDDLVFSTGFCVIRPRPEVADSRFIHHLLVSDLVIDEIVADSTGTSYPATSATKISRLKVPAPSLEVQRAIADYLDRETAEIDAMSADLDEMEKLLAERRTSAISRFIESAAGAEVPIVMMAKVTIGKMIQSRGKRLGDVEAPYLRAAHIPAPGTLNMTTATKKMWFSPEELDYLTVRAGDVLIVEGGAGFGRAAVVTDDMEGWGFQNSIIRVRALEGVASGRFISYALQQAQAEGKIELQVSTATLPHFTAEKVERFRLPLPTLEEQRRIVDEIDRDTAEIDAMLADITELRDLLAERRAAVIAAAVTGQIDVPALKETTHA
ncbi:restriction endonuclease subunit S [Corynebacterium jeikeium]|uniref:restriction endonuclease subunit S n=1 Tax=Corynebacterium jeikeium TaxID=38289 RepID=UPI001558BB52|nr:restriction endonuclease subunit S [Corynebacterium jeikeium]